MSRPSPRWAATKLGALLRTPVNQQLLPRTHRVLALNQHPARCDRLMIGVGAITGVVMAVSLRSR